MENNQTMARRRRDYLRSARSERTITNGNPGFSGSDLFRWRRLLAKMESDAARYHLGEVEMLLGAAGLAIEDAIGQETASRA